jgi:FtsZ-interacting cell division protein ZipA
MRKYKNLMGCLQIVTLVALIALVITGCGTTKTVEHSMLKSNEVTTIQADSAYTKTTQILTFGDTLKGSSFIPGDSKGSDTTQTDSIETESAGIKLKIKVTTTKNKAGALLGNKIDYSAIAKPTAKQTTNEAHQASVSTQQKKTVKATAAVVTDTKTGFAVPSWVWWLVIIITALFGVLIYFTYKNSIIAWIKKLL